MQQKSDIVIGYKGLYNKIGLSKWTAIRLIKSGQLPAPINISTKRIGWRETVLDEWLNNGGVKK